MAKKKKKPAKTPPASRDEIETQQAVEQRVRNGMQNNPKCPYCDVACVTNGTHPVNGIPAVLRYFKCPNRDRGCPGRYTTHIIDAAAMQAAIEADRPQEDYSAR